MSLKPKLVSLGCRPTKGRFSLTAQVVTAFISYAWQPIANKDWVRAFATRLRDDGVNAILDQWEVRPGDRIPQFMTQSISKSDYVLIVCTESYKRKSDDPTYDPSRAPDDGVSGVSFEGYIMTAELLAGISPERKFIPIWRDGKQWKSSAPSWVVGKRYIDFRGDPYNEDAYSELLDHLLDHTPKPPPIKGLSIDSSSDTVDADETASRRFEVEMDYVENDTDSNFQMGSLYKVRIRLSTTPSRRWAQDFTKAWDHPRVFTTLHRPGIASVEGDHIILDGTNLGELQEVHLDTLRWAIKEANRSELERLEKEAKANKERAEKIEEERARRREALKRINLDNQKR